MISMKRKELERRGEQALKILKKTKLDQGFPFMINSALLPPDESYLEYPNGLIVHVGLSSEIRDFKIIKNLSPEESLEIKRKFKLG